MQAQANERSAFFHGVFTGIAATMVALQAVLAWLMFPMAATFADLGDGNAQIPAISQLVTSHAFLFIAPVAGAMAVAALMIRRPRRTGPYIASALLLFALVVVTIVCAYMPLWQLAGQIKADDEPTMRLEPLDALPQR